MRDRFRAMSGNGVVVIDNRTGNQVARPCGPNGDALRKGEAIAVILNDHAAEYDALVEGGDGE
jgi:hypothetical protein